MTGILSPPLCRFATAPNSHANFQFRRPACTPNTPYRGSDTGSKDRIHPQAVARAVREGRLLYRDAFDLTGLRGATFDRYIASVEASAGG